MAKKQLSSQPIKFQVTYDNEARAAYFKFSDNKVAKTIEHGTNGEALIDLDRNGKLVGVEFLNPRHITLIAKKIVRSGVIRDTTPLQAVNRLAHVLQSS